MVTIRCEQAQVPSDDIQFHRHSNERMESATETAVFNVRTLKTEGPSCTMNKSVVKGCEHNILRTKIQRIDSSTTGRGRN